MIGRGEGDRGGEFRPGLIPAPVDIRLVKAARKLDYRRLIWIGLGALLFILVYLWPWWPEALDPAGRRVALSLEARGALALFLLAAAWWASEVIPIGVTALAVGALQVLFRWRPAAAAFKDFLDPAVFFIFGSLLFGMVLAKTGLIKRFSYRMLILAGERTGRLYLGCFLMIAALTLIMAHTTAAAAVFPLLMAVYSLYPDADKPTRFGKGLFIGLAFSAGAGSIVTLLGSARAPMALGFYREITGRDLPFAAFPYYLFPLGLALILVIWALFLIWFKPEAGTIPGLRDRARALYAKLGPISRAELLALMIVALSIVLICLQPLHPLLGSMEMTAVILAGAAALFLFKLLDIEDLEDLPWNIILLYGGVMSLGFGLFQTGAAEWLAWELLPLFSGRSGLWFVMALALVTMLFVNFVMNVAVIALLLPVAVIMAKPLGVNPEAVVLVILAASGLPFLFLIGAAPNAIAFGSRQFRPPEFFRAGLAVSFISLLILALFVAKIWPLMGLAVLLPRP